MLAQSTNAAPQAAIGSPGGFGPAPASLEGGAGKKERAAGLFAEALTQAQKKNEPKGRETSKVPTAEGHDGAGLRRAGDLEKGPRKKAEAVDSLLGKATRGAGAADSESTDRKALNAPDPSLGRRARIDTDKAHAADAQSAAVAASSSKERRSAARAGEAGESATASPHGADDRRRLKDKRDAPADDASAALALAGARAQPANPARARAAASGAEGEATIEKKAERGASEPKVTILDLRRSAEAKREAISKAEAGKTDEAQRDVPKEPKAGVDGSREAYRELTLEARDAGASPAGKAEAGQGRSQDFQTVMAERMREAWNGEIVKSAHIVLKDGDAGTIRLRLRPESLGSVKVELNLSENNISGRIIVESEEAKTAFERNMGELSDAFRQGGFDSAKLEVSVGGSGNGASGRADSSGTPFFSERLRSAVSSPGEPATAASAYARRGAAVDILA